jgi:hypothetical protein
LILNPNIKDENKNNAKCVKHGFYETLIWNMKKYKDMVFI